NALKLKTGQNLMILVTTCKGMMVIRAVPLPPVGVLAVMPVVAELTVTGPTFPPLAPNNAVGVPTPAVLATLLLGKLVAWVCPGSVMFVVSVRFGRLAGAIARFC